MSPREATRREPVRRAESPATRPSVAPAPSAVSSAPEPPARAERPERRRDIAPRGEWEPPRKRAIDTSNPYDEDQ